MRIVHRVSVASSDDVSRQLARIGVEVSSQGLVSFEISEADPRWPELQRWVQSRRASDVIRTLFSKAELAAAGWLEMVPSWHHGYPQPEEDSFGYLTATYDLTDYCEICGVGLRQAAAFQMRGEPRWGRYGILQLHWVFDEFFTTRDVWEAVFMPQGVGHRHVLDTSGRVLKTAVQLEIEATVDILTQGLIKQTCPACKRVKYAPAVRGRFPPLTSQPRAPMCKTNAWFGSGASASRRVMASQAVRQALAKMGVRGVSFRPVEHVG